MVDSKLQIYATDAITYYSVVITETSSTMHFTTFLIWHYVCLEWRLWGGICQCQIQRDSADFKPLLMDLSGDSMTKPPARYI